MTPRPLAGKAIVITGAGRGIGAAYARAAAVAGAAVVVSRGRRSPRNAASQLATSDSASAHSVMSAPDAMASAPAARISAATRSTWRAAVWTVARISDASDRDLKQRQFPTGLVGVTAQPQSISSAFWEPKA